MILKPLVIMIVVIKRKVSICVVHVNAWCPCINGMSVHERECLLISKGLIQIILN